MLKYLIKILFTLIFIALSNTSILAVPHKVRKLIPANLDIGFDITRPLYYSIVENTGGQYEISTSLDINQILLQGDFGWGTIARKSPLLKPISNSTNEGQYFRLGLSYNFMPKIEEHNTAFLGVRFAKALLEDSLSGIVKNAKNSDIKLTKTINDKQALSATWWEIVAGVQVKLWHWLYAGCTVRYKFAKSITSSKPLIHMPFDILGFGINEDDAFGINYTLSFRIPLSSREHEHDLKEKQEITSKGATSNSMLLT